MTDSNEPKWVFRTDLVYCATIKHLKFKAIWKRRTQLKESQREEQRFEVEALILDSFFVLFA